VAHVTIRLVEADEAIFEELVDGALLGAAATFKIRGFIGLNQEIAGGVWRLLTFHGSRGTDSIMSHESKAPTVLKVLAIGLWKKKGRIGRVSLV
jgi:hypothetical protein